MPFDPVEFINGVHGCVMDQIKPVIARIAEIEKRQPEKGEQGPTGPAGENGRNGLDGKSVTPDDVLPALREELKVAIDAIPKPQDGRDGVNGVDGKDGIPGKDGKSISLEEARGLLTDIHEMSVSKWALDFERRASDLIQRCIDRIPAPENGKDGRDGVGFDDLTVEHDGTGLVSIKFVRGSVTKSFDIRLPVLIDKGIFKDEEIYQKGDCVTCGGSLWIAQTDKAVGKPGISEDWRLAVKRGRDGKDFSK